MHASPTSTRRTTPSQLKVATRLVRKDLRINAGASVVLKAVGGAAAYERFKAQMAGRVPQKRIGTPEEAANVAAFLLSGDASHVTAQSLAVDGGLLGTLMIES